MDGPVKADGHLSSFEVMHDRTFKLKWTVLDQRTVIRTELDSLE